MKAEFDAAWAIREKQRAIWVAAAPGWIDDGDASADPTSPATKRLIELARIREGDAVLDVACGGGDPALSIAGIVGKRGRVLAVDIVPEMVEGARKIARERGLGNVEFRVIADECAIGAEEAAFDAVTCRFGLMFMPDPPAAARAWRALLRQDGRIAVSTWATFPVLAFLWDVIARRVPLPAIDPAAPGILALHSADVLEAILRAAGYEDVAVERVNVGLFEELPPAEWWDLMARTAGPLVPLLASLPAEIRRAVRTDGIRALVESHPSGLVAEKGDALLASGTNPRLTD